MAESSAGDSKSMIATMSHLKVHLEKVEDRCAVKETDRPIYQKASDSVNPSVIGDQRTKKRTISQS